MKVALISPPTDSAITRVLGTTGPPLGLAYLAAAIRDEHDVRIIDSTAEGLDKADLERVLKREDPDIVGISATTSMIPDAYETAEIAKRLNENVKVVLGGPHATFLPERTMRECPYVDFVVRGEGEETFRELVSAVEKGRDLRAIRGVSFKENGRTVNNPPRGLVNNLDDLPIPAYDLLPMERYSLDGVQFGAVITSRGCPFNCAFCSSSRQFGGTWRGHSPERVLEELRILRDEFGKREIEFLDDTFTLSKRRAIEISDAIRREGLDISWTASSRVDTFSREVAESMRRGRATTVYFGIESASERILDFIGKRITPEKSAAAVRCSKRAGLSVVGSFVIGFPDETPEEVRKTVDFSRRLDLDLAQFTIATPYPGTRLWDYAERRSLFLTWDWRKFTTLDPVMRLKNFTSSQISRIMRFAYLRFYLRPKFIIRDLVRRKGVILRKAISYLKSFLVRGPGEGPPGRAE
ncbi:MAG: cobalamin-dependent protein [Hadesarchaea archaeon]|nr:cobalamin-dependent protein [Hadesarchaea archaeon]